MCVPTLPRARIGPSRHSCTFCKADFCSHHTCFITWGAHLGSAGQGTDSPLQPYASHPHTLFPDLARWALPAPGCPLSLQCFLVPPPPSEPLSACSLALQDPAVMSPLSAQSESTIAFLHTPARSHTSISVCPGLVSVAMHLVEPAPALTALEGGEGDFSFLRKPKLC